MELNMTSGMSGIKKAYFALSALQESETGISPGALPQAIAFRAVGAKAKRSTKLHEPGQVLGDHDDLLRRSLDLNAVSPPLSPARLPLVMAGVEGDVVRGVTASPPVCCADLSAAILFVRFRSPRTAGVSFI